MTISKEILLNQFRSVLKQVGPDISPQNYDDLEITRPARTTLRRKFGSWSEAKALALGEDVINQTHKALADQNKTLLQQIEKERNITQAFINNCLAGMAKMNISPVQIPKKEIKTENLEAHAMRSDAHVGEYLDPTSVQNLSHYDSTTYKQRVQRWTEKIIQFREQDKKSLGLNKLVIHHLGDQVTGESIYKGQAFYLDLNLTDQLFLSVEVESNAILALAKVYPEVELFCCHPDTEITMANFESKKIPDITIGDKVITAQNNIQTVTNIMNRSIDEDIFEINFEGISYKPLKITGDHPILSKKRDDIRCKIPCWEHRKAVCWRTDNEIIEFYPCKNCSERKGESDPSFHKASELQEGDYIAIPKLKIPITNELTEINVKDYIGDKIVKEFDGKVGLHKTFTSKMIPSTIPITPEFLRLLGYFLAEGHIVYGTNGKAGRKAVGTCFSFDATREDLIQDTKNIAQNVFGLSCKQYYPHKSATQIIIGSNVLAELVLKLCGEYAKHKRIHSDLLNKVNPELLLNIITGWALGDGCVMNYEEYDTFDGVTVSLNLAKQIQSILIRNNSPCTIRKRKQYNGDIINGKKIKGRQQAYSISINGVNINKIIESSSTQKKSRSRIKQDKYYFYAPIKRINKTKYSGLVYNLSVSNDESYIAGMVAVHNCVVGNHGRPGAYGMNHKKTNFDYLFYRSLKQILVNQKNIKVFVSESPSMVVQHGNFIFLLNHGDAAKGWMGIPFYGLERMYRRLPNLYNMVVNYELVGHHHQPANISDSMILLNGSLVGGSELSINRMGLTNLPSQKLFYFDKKHGINRETNLHLADPVKLKADEHGIFTQWV